MTRTADFYLERANAAYLKGFTTKAAQQAALADVTKAYGLVVNQIIEPIRMMFNDQRTEAQNAALWAAPDYPHQWKPKHRETIEAAGIYADELFLMIDEIVAFRNSVKSAEIVKFERVESARVKAVAQKNKSIKEFMEQRKIQVMEGVEMAKLFGGLHVTASAHLVVNEHGTRFFRVFYYLNGKLTALSVIIAIAESLENQ